MRTTPPFLERLRTAVNRQRLLDTARRLIAVPSPTGSGGAVAMLAYYALGTVAYAGYLWGRFSILKPSFGLPRLSLEPVLAILRVGGMSAVVSASCAGQATKLMEPRSSPHSFGRP